MNRVVQQSVTPHLPVNSDEITNFTEWQNSKVNLLSSQTLQVKYVNSGKIVVLIALVCIRVLWRSLTKQRQGQRTYI